MTKTLVSSMALSSALALSLLVGGCSKQAPPQVATTTQPTPAAQPAPAAAPAAAAPVQESPAPPPERTERRAERSAPAPEPVDYSIPAGTRISVTTDRELSSKTSQPGEQFSATVANAIRVNGRTIVRAGSRADGTVTTASSQGRFKGQGELALRLDTIHADGRDYPVETSSITQVQKGKGKRTAVLAGGGGGLGALIGGLAGGGKGALIGGLLGAGGGTAGAAFTGNKQIIIPAETTLTFRLENSVSVRR